MNALDVKYVSADGQTVSFSAFPFMLQDPEELLSYEWEYEIVANKVTSIKRVSATKSFTLSVFADSESDFNRYLNTLQEIFETDILNATPGRLYFGDYYLKCYIYAGSYSDCYDDFYAADKKFDLISDVPFWIREIVVNCMLRNDTDNYAYLDYDFDYNFDFLASSTILQIKNTALTNCDFEIVIIGPAANPTITIGNYVYSVKIDIKANEYLTINSQNKTILLTKSNGDVENCYYLKDSKNYIFQPIERGANTIQWNGDFNFVVTLFEKRSEPLWT